MRCISSREDETLRRDCQYRVQVPGKRGSFRQEFDNVLYLAKLAAACTVYPNLNDAELQDSYGVKCAEELISAMLTPGEYTNYTEKLFDICGFGDAPDLEEQAKNWFGTVRALMIMKRMQRITACKSSISCRPNI